MKILMILLFSAATFTSACDTDNATSSDDNDMVVNSDAMARVVSVTSSGTENNYNFSVGVSSPDTGCNQYADWWEVLTEDGTLLYRRILAHSHVDEQPFIRSGGAVAITSTQVVIVRAHMNTSGYGTEAFVGNIEGGFTSTTLDEDFAQALATVAPLPSNCAF